MRHGRFQSFLALLPAGVLGTVRGVLFVCAEVDPNQPGIYLIEPSFTNQVNLHLNTFSNHANLLQYTGSLSNGGRWTNMGNPFPKLPFQIHHVITDTSSPAPQRFYRLVTN